MSKCVGVTDDNKAKAIKLRLVSQDLADTAKKKKWAGCISDYVEWS